MTSASILLVEDNPDDITLTLRALRKKNILNEVTVAHDGAEALDIIFAEERALPGLVLLDLNLPKVTGLQVLTTIRSDERTRLVPVVVLTTSTLEEDIVASYRCGANGYVRKPVHLAEFAEAINTLGMFWLSLNQSVRARGVTL